MQAKLLHLTLEKNVLEGVMNSERAESLDC